MSKKPTIVDISNKLDSLAKDDDLSDKLHELEKKEAVREALRQNNWWWIKKLLAMCLVMWSMISFAGKEVGGFLYNNYPPIRIGVDAAIAAWGSRHE
jgi:hypothetical protein